MKNRLENLSVRNAARPDISSIRQLAVDANIDAWSEADYLDEIVRPDSFVLKAIHEGLLLGFLVARIVPGTTADPDADLYNIGVAPDHARRGIGTLLLHVLRKKLVNKGVQSLWLEVRESNFEAISFYEHHGFRAEVTRPSFYSNPSENAVIMRLQLTSGRGVSDVKTILDSRVEEE